MSSYACPSDYNLFRVNFERRLPMCEVIFRNELEEILNVAQGIVSGSGQQELIVSRDKRVTQRTCTF